MNHLVDTAISLLSGWDEKTTLPLLYYSPQHKHHNCVPPLFLRALSYLSYYSFYICNEKLIKKESACATPASFVQCFLNPRTSILRTLFLLLGKTHLLYHWKFTYSPQPVVFTAHLLVRPRQQAGRAFQITCFINADLFSDSGTIHYL